MPHSRSSYRAAFDDGVQWDIEGREWVYSGWAFSTLPDPFDLVLEVGAVRLPIARRIQRPDVVSAYGLSAEAGQCGYAGTLPVEAGTVRVKLVAIAGERSDCILERTLTVAAAPLRFHIDTPGTGTIESGSCRVSGWCFHPDDVIDSLMILTADGHAKARYGLLRGDVAAAIPGAPEACGFEAFVVLAPGRIVLGLEARLHGGARVRTMARAPLRVRGRGIARLGRALLQLTRKALAWRRSRGRWPHPREWRHLASRVSQEMARTMRGNGAGNAWQPPPPIDRYQAWLAVNAWSAAAEQRLRRRLAEAGDTLPLVSVVMPVYNPQPALLAAAVDSVRAQVYPRWELCIADDCSLDPGIRAYLRNLAGIEDRVRLRLRTVNGNISAATNDAADLASGEILVFLDHDDVLTPDCLAEFALAAIAQPSADLFYSDDDKITVEGSRHSPQFKPQWSPELLLSYMYMSHAFAVRRSLFEAIGGMRIGYEGSQDHDFALRATERTHGVAHIPRVLYHWRVVEGSTAERGDAKPASFEAGRLAVEEALTRRRLQVSVARPGWAEKARIGVFAHEFPDDGPEVTIIVPTRNQCALLEKCLRSLAKTTYRNYRVLVVDNGSDDPETIALLRTCGHEVLRIASPGGKFNFAHLNNVAASHARTEFLLFLNNDTEVLEPRWLSRMMGYAALRGVGAVGARLLHGDGTIQHAGVVHGYYDGLAGPAFRNLRQGDAGYLCYAKVSRNYGAVTAACMVTPRTTFLARGGFDENRFGVAYNDVDYCYRLADAGMRSVYAAGAELRHHEGRSRGFGDEPREVAEFKRTHRLRRDAYYSAHLGLDDEHFAIRPVKVETGTPPRRIRSLMCAFNLNWEGAPYCQFEMTRELVRRGVLDPVVYSPVDGPLRASYEDAGIAVRVRPHPLVGCATREQYDAAVDEFAGWIASLNVAVVYGNTLQTFYAIDAARRAGVPSLWNPRESEPWREYFRGFGTDIERAALRCFQYPYRVVFVARATARVYGELDSQHNFCVVHDGLDTSGIQRDKATLDRSAVRRQLGLHPDDVAILLLGTVCARKGQHESVRAWSALSATAARAARLFIVGDRPGDYSTKLRALLSQLPQDRRERVEVVAETGMVVPYLRAADVFLCTSRIESYPRVILEAMAWDLPIVTTPVFGIAEQVRAEINALVYEPGDVPGLARQLNSLIVDRELRDRLARRAADVLATLNDFHHMTDQYGRLFEEAALQAETLAA